MRSFVPLALGLVLGGCRPAPSAPVVPVYDYRVSPPPLGSWIVHVDATYQHAPSSRFVDPEAGDAITHLSLVDRSGSAQPLARMQEGWLAPSCRDTCTLRYELDLAALAEACGRIDCAHRAGDAVIGVASTWMVRPDPAGDAIIHVQMTGPDAGRVATGLRRDGAGRFALRGHELGEASYTAFGDLRRSRLAVGGGGLDVVLLGAPLAMGDAAVLSWVRDAAMCVDNLYGAFPAEATVFVIPVKGADEVVFGRVMSLAGGSVALLFGEDTRADREHSDWVVVHELSHLGTASFMGEAHWLEEGLATYYEPILRERAGWITEAELWSHFADQMPRGERKPADPPSLEERDDIDSTYWGGALFVMLADLRIREATQGQKSMDDVLRAAHERLGDATHATRLVDFLKLGDEATGTHALSDVYAHFAVAGEGVDLALIWKSLGVTKGADGALSLSDQAPLASVRHAIATGIRH